MVFRWWFVPVAWIRPLVLAAALPSACSFGISGPPSTYRPDQAPRCDVSRAAPIADTIGTAAFGSGAIYLVTAPSRTTCDDGDNSCGMFDGLVEGIGVALLIPTFVYATAATIGFVRTSECSDAFEEHAKYRSRRPGIQGDAPARRRVW